MHTLLYVVVVYVCTGRWGVRMHTDVGTTESGLLSSKEIEFHENFGTQQNSKKKRNKTAKRRKTTRVIVLFTQLVSLHSLSALKTVHPLSRLGDILLWE